MSEEDKRFNLSLEDLAKYSWQDVISATPDKRCSAFSSSLGNTATKARENGDELGRRVFSFLATIASFHNQFDNKANPYGCLWLGFNGMRTFGPDDLDAQDIALLSAIVNDIQDPEFRARVADLLWIVRKNFKAANTAVVSFIQSAERLKDGENWTDFIERLGRAAQIAAKKGFETQCQLLVSRVEGFINELHGDLKNGLACMKLMRILLWLEEGDESHYAQLAENLAKQFAQIRDWRFSQEYWVVASNWYSRLNNAIESSRCKLEAAECDISNAEEIANKGSQLMHAARWMSRGLEALRQAKADSYRIQAVHARLLRIQENSLSELSFVSLNEDEIQELDKPRERAQKVAVAMVSGVSLETALERLALAIRPTNYLELKKREEDFTKQGYISQFFETSILDAAGKITARVPGTTPTGEDEEQVIRKRLAYSARNTDWPVRVDLSIEPARTQIVLEHPLRYEDLAYLVEANPFIPPGHEEIYLRGIQSGFFGDWLVAMHLLVPQIEPSIRHILNCRGIRTSKMASDQTQEDFDLNHLLRMPEVEDIFDQDILFDLRGILIDRCGYNLRNELAHGLLPTAGFYTSAAAPYFWWLVLRLLHIGYINLRKHTHQETGK